MSSFNVNGAGHERNRHSLSDDWKHGHGHRHLHSKGGKVTVVAKLSGLSPGSHGFHIHEEGDCSSGDGMSAGGHFNPTGKSHGDPYSPDHHAGDMPMLVADASGNASLTAELSPMTVGAGTTDIIGKAVIVHRDPDDYKTQPTGNSGARVACGVINRP